MPGLVFGVQFNETAIDENFKFNGQYLDELTKDLTFEKIFEKNRLH